MKKPAHSVFRMLFYLFILSFPIKEANAWGHFKLRLVKAKPINRPTVRKVKRIVKSIPVFVPARSEEITVVSDNDDVVKEEIPQEVIVEKKSVLRHISFRHSNSKKEVTNTIAKENILPVIQTLKEVKKESKAIKQGEKGPLQLLGLILTCFLLVILVVLLLSLLFLIFGVTGILFLALLLLIPVVILLALIFAGGYKLTHWKQGKTETTGKTKAS